MPEKPVKVVLLNPPLRNLVSAATPGYVDENRGFSPPMGLLYVQAAVEHSPHESLFLDANVEGWDHETAARNALAHAPDLVGLQAMTFTMPDACLVAKAVKRLSPDTKVLIGGPHPTIYPQETAGLPYIDYAFAGEGELGFVQFLDRFYDAKALSSVPGIAFKGDGEIHYVEHGGLIPQLNTILRPARQSSPYTRYSSVLAERNPVTILITSRGCPFKCVFCNRMGRKYRFHSADYVLEEIKEIIELGIPEIFVHDDTFTLNRHRVEAICNGILDRKFDVIWEARTRVDCVDQDLLALMRKAGCRRLSFGVESGSPRVLASMRKGIDLNRVVEVFRWCRREGIATLADFMIGSLDEQTEDIRKTFDLVGRIDPDYVQYSICSPYPGTPLYEIGLKKGLIPADVWREFATDPLKEFRSPLWTQHFTEQELISITARAYRKFYLRPAFVMKQLKRVNSLAQFKGMVRGALGMLRK